MIETQTMVQQTVDESKPTNRRLIITAGMGFFTDAYDLFIIGVVSAILSPIWHLTIGKIALLNAASLLAAAFGAIIFGILSDTFGRKKLYGLEMVILFAGAVLSATSQSFIMLFIARIIVGLGIGGDYPSSAVVASEHSTQQRRGLLVLLVFAMQAVGLIFGPLLASLLLASHLPTHLLWRILLGLGAVPAALAFYLRRRLKDSKDVKKLLKAKLKANEEQPPLEVSRVVYDLTLDGESKDPVPYLKQKLWDLKWLKYLLGTAGAWFLLDVAFYGNGITSVMIINSIQPHASLLDHTLIATLIFLLFAVPGYFVAALTVDKIGRKPLQIGGFLMITICYAIIALVPSIQFNLPLFVAVFGVSFFFVNFGPNTTTFLIPSEIYPTSIRAKAHGISAAVGKIGAFVGALLVPISLHLLGMPATMGYLAFTTLLGALLTLLLPEMKHRDLSDTETLSS